MRWLIASDTGVDVALAATVSAIFSLFCRLASIQRLASRTGQGHPRGRCWMLLHEVRSGAERLLGWSRQMSCVVTP
jgi:hypothetical protein